jgi:hypothetical protein
MTWHVFLEVPECPMPSKRRRQTGALSEKKELLE